VDGDPTVTAGRTVFFAGDVTATPVDAVHLNSPTALAAFFTPTRALMNLPASAYCSVYVSDVTPVPVIATQPVGGAVAAATIGLATRDVHRYQRYSMVGVWNPAVDTFVTPSVFPSTGLPVRTGSCVNDAGTLTGCGAAAHIVTAPYRFVEVSATDRYFPAHTCKTLMVLAVGLATSSVVMARHELG
jgi:hypothetical protein